MTKQTYNTIETFMLNHMDNSAHDKHHIDRVLNAAVDIACHETNVDMDVLVAACLLHDIGRGAQEENPALCHAEVGAEMAYEFLTAEGWQAQKARHVAACIFTHRYRNDRPPRTLEAKILFDADKLEACGVIGIARTLIYAGQCGEPLYIIDEKGRLQEERRDPQKSSFMGEYNFKLKNVYDVFYTTHAKKLAKTRQKDAENFYRSLFTEVTENYKNGKKLSEVMKWQ